LAYTGAVTNKVKFDSKDGYRTRLAGVMVRFEFMEFIVRIAEGRFCKGDGAVTSSVAEGLTMFLDLFLYENYRDNSWHSFRT
jgi:hypothetical protein